MSLPRNPISRSLPVLALLLVSSCTTPGAIPPPVADLKAVTEPEPVPGDDIATSQQAYDQHQASVEAWGKRLHDAGGRLCRWSQQVYKLGIDCPKTLTTLAPPAAHR